MCGGIRGEAGIVECGAGEEFVGCLDAKNRNVYKQTLTSLHIVYDTSMPFEKVH